MRWAFAFVGYAAVTLVRAQGFALGMQDGWAVGDQDEVILSPAMARAMRDCGSKWVRLHFRLTSKHHTFDAELLRLYGESVRNCRDAGMEVLGLFTYESVPGRQEDWIANSFERHKGTGDNAYVRKFAESFGKVAGAFPQVAAWEIWNEPNCWTTAEPSDLAKMPGGYYLYPSNFAWMMRRCFEVARALPHRPKVVSGGLLGMENSTDPRIGSGAAYLAATFAMGRRFASWDSTRARFGAFPADGWGLHLYLAPGSVGSVELFSRFYQAFIDETDRLEGAGRRAPIWMTEVGWNTAPGGLSEADQASNAARILQVLASNSRSGPLTWFKLRDEPAPQLWFGVLREDLTPKPAYGVIREFAARRAR